MQCDHSLETELLNSTFMWCYLFCDSVVPTFQSVDQTSSIKAYQRLLV